jgi:diguanylate cyclase (GGDEF)-like protein/PAS domain S-box-containing protein
MTMKPKHNLLERQIKKYFGGSPAFTGKWQEFIDAVNNAYIQSDVDRSMLERSLDLSSRELLQANSEMRNLISLLNATIESTADGILVVDGEGKTVSFNQKFIEMWRIPKQIEKSCDDDQALSFVLDQLENPAGFLRKVKELYAEPEKESYDVLKFKDGRIFERYSQPQKIEGKSVGRVWSFRDITARKRTEDALLESERKYRNLVANAPVGVYKTNLKGEFIFANDALARMLEFGSPEELMAGSVLSVYRNLEDRNVLLGELEKYGRVESFDLELLTRRGNVKSVLLNATLEKERSISGMIVDMTGRKRAENALRESEEKYRSLVHSTEDSIYLVDRNYKYLFMNKRHVARMGFSGDEYIGRSFGEFHSPENTKWFVEKADEVFHTGKSIQHEHKRGNDGRCFLLTLSPVKEPDGKIKAVTVVSKDISRIKTMEAKLRTLSLTDELTGLYNRRGFFTVGEQLLKQSRRQKAGIFVLYADVDDLKDINDKCGHREGDMALIQAADVLRGTFRESDIIARIGGDEFVVLAMETTKNGAEKLENRLQSILNAHNARNQLYKLSLSIGIAYCAPECVYSIDELLIQGDQLMYEQKKSKAGIGSSVKPV